MLLYSLDNVRINDSWYCRDENGTYHSFFLEYGCDEPPEFCWSRQRVGHMTSRDLLHWSYEGTALKADKNSWNDIGIATGSVVKHRDLWYMMYSGNSSFRGGLGIAVSRDLKKWERVGNAPAIFSYELYPFEYGGETVQVCPLADPYIYPERIDGDYYIFVNSWVSGRSLNRRGAQAVFATKDFKEFVPRKIALIADCDRLETAQVWKHDDKFYMYAGCVTVTAPEKANIMSPEHFKMLERQESENSIFVSDKIDGPYTTNGTLKFPEPAESGSLYIAKVLKDLKGRDVLLVNNIPNGVMGPYPIVYGADGITLWK